MTLTAAEARQHIDWAHDAQASEGHTDRSVTDLALLAVAEATLAVAEQQRIANLLAIYHAGPEGSSSVEARNAAYRAIHDCTTLDADPLRPEIAAALGIGGSA